MGMPIINERRFTYADYGQWPEDERFELIDGVAYAMGPAPVRRHQVFVLEIARQIANALKGRTCQPFIAPFDVRLPKPGRADETADTVLQPDIAVVCDPDKLDERGCRGAPDWVIEVVSPATASRDHILKREVYERAGVREYWIVHPVDRIVTVYILSADAYPRNEVYELSGTQASMAVPEVVIDWGELPPE
jgi:Uma2 family endonuclease